MISISTISASASVATMKVSVQQAVRVLAGHFGCRRVAVLLQADTEQTSTSPEWVLVAFSIGNIVFGVSLAICLAGFRWRPAPAVAASVQVHLEVAGSRRRQKLVTPITQALLLLRLQAAHAFHQIVSPATALRPGTYKHPGQMALLFATCALSSKLIALCCCSEHVQC